MSFTNLHAYINQGWEIGIENCTRGLQQRGVTRAQLMETIMHAQLSAGIRGLECCYRALGIILGDYRRATRACRSSRPAGRRTWPAFYCGLDPTTKELTPEDQRAIEGWYERTIGEVPRWVRVLARVDPISLKGHRARWEGCFRGALPKQMMPYLSIHHHTIVGNREGLREAVLLGKAWGMTNAYIVNTIVTAAYYFTGPRADGHARRRHRRRACVIRHAGIAVVALLPERPPRPVRNCRAPASCCRSPTALLTLSNSDCGPLRGCRAPGLLRE